VVVLLILVLDFVIFFMDCNLLGIMDLEKIYKGNSQTTLTLIKDGVPPSHHFAPIIDNIRSFISSD